MRSANPPCNDDDQLLAVIPEHLIERIDQLLRAPLNSAARTKLEGFRQLLLTPCPAATNTIVGGGTQNTAPSDFTKAYLEKMKAYQSAVLEYNKRSMRANSAATPQAIHDFALNGRSLRSAVTVALHAWVARGHKGTFEQMSAFVDRLQREFRGGHAGTASAPPTKNRTAGNAAPSKSQE